MKLLIPFSYYYPEQCAGIYIIEDIMHEAAKQGIASLITVPFPTRNVPRDARWMKDEYKENGRIHIHRFWMFGERKNPFLRALRYLLCELIQLHYMLWRDYDVAFIDSTPPIQGLKLPIVKLFRHKPVIYNAQDLFPETLSGSGLAKKGGLLWRIGVWVSKITFNHSDIIITISEDIKQGIINRGVPERKIKVIYNWVDADTLVSIDKSENPLFEEFGLLSSVFTLVYAGNLGNAQNISIILDAAFALPNVQFAIFGTGGLEDEIKERIMTEKLQNVHLNPLQPFERVSHVYSMGDACIVSCKPGFGGSAMPSKTWSIMSCSRPVIASFDEGELQSIIDMNKCGIFTHAGNVTEFIEAIRFLASKPSICEEMGRKARSFVTNNLTKEVGTNKYVDLIKSFDK